MQARIHASEQMEHSSSASGNANMYSYYGNQHSVPQKIRNKSTSKHPVLLLCVYPKDVHSYHKDTCPVMFTVPLFVIASTWKQARWPSTEEYIKKIWYIYTMAYYSAVKNHWHHEIQRQMKRTKKNHPGRGNSDSERQTCYILTYKWI